MLQEYHNLVYKDGWYLNSFETDKQSGKVSTFKEKEGKWFNNISGITTKLSNIDTSEFSVQGIGTPAFVATNSTTIADGGIIDLGTTGDLIFTVENDTSDSSAWNYNDWIIAGGGSTNDDDSENYDADDTDG